jgi:hypothetical protein
MHNQYGLPVKSWGKEGWKFLFQYSGLMLPGPPPHLSDTYSFSWRHHKIISLSLGSNVNRFTIDGRVAAILCFSIALLFKYLKGNFYCINKFEIGEKYRMQRRGDNKRQTKF